jgi:hypothetical protein
MIIIKKNRTFQKNLCYSLENFTIKDCLGFLIMYQKVAGLNPAGVTKKGHSITNDLFCFKNHSITKWDKGDY